MLGDKLKVGFRYRIKNRGYNTRPKWSLLPNGKYILSKVSSVTNTFEVMDIPGEFIIQEHDFKSLRG